MECSDETLLHRGCAEASLRLCSDHAQEAPDFQVCTDLPCFQAQASEDSFACSVCAKLPTSKLLLIIA